MPQTYCHSEGGADPNLTVLTYPEPTTAGMLQLYTVTSTKKKYQESLKNEKNELFLKSVV
jgi:hypothetical protein